jgi:ammonium transporter Rh
MCGEASPRSGFASPGPQLRRALSGAGEGCQGERRPSPQGLDRHVGVPLPRRPCVDRLSVLHKLLQSILHTTVREDRKEPVNHRRRLGIVFGMLAALLIPCALVGASELPVVSGGVADITPGALEQVQKYERAIHVMAMLLLGFGFLMVFVKRYGRSALTATYLLVSVALPFYFLLNSNNAFGPREKFDIDRLLLAEFAAASLLICAGAVLGRLKMVQYVILALLFVPAYMANEWIILKGGLGFLPAGRFLDTGGSIVIHAFGALFGLGAILSLTSRREFATPIESDATSDRYSLLGSMVLWVFWPSFCSALVTPQQVPATAINVIFALCGSTLATYVANVMLRRKISPADIANATLAGGVAIGTTCASPNFYGGAFAIGVAAGALSTFGFAVLQTRLQNWMKRTDTCGVLYLHGLPGLMGGLAGLLAVPSGKVQVIGIAISAAIALLTGCVAGQILSAFGKRVTAYTDEEEMLVDESPAEAKPEAEAATV